MGKGAGKGSGCGSSKAVKPPAAEPGPADDGPAQAPSKAVKPSKRGQKKADDGGIEIRAAMLIQRWYRRHKAALALRAKCTWQVFTRMEFQSEQEQTGLSDFFADLGQLKEALERERSDLSAAARRSSGSSKSSGESAHLVKKRVGHNIDAAESVVSAETEDLLFDRPNKPSNISAKVLKDLIRGCQDDQIISAELVMCILDEAYATQKTYPNIRKMGTDVARRVNVVGDLHGQFSDLILIFKREGIPSATNPYIFNGDIVDRGHKSVELCAVVLGFQLLYPHSVFINRGNHEDYLMNKRYGFEQEIQSKYGGKASKLLRAFGALFSALPFCTVIDSKVFVVHGGISDGTDLEVLEHLQRQQYVSILRAAKSQGAENGPDPTETDHVVNAVWSDPGHEPGCTRNKQRGGGCVWGPDITAAFLERYDFSMIVRSHECCQSGYRWAHGKKVLTVFSSSNYYAPGSNTGAYVVFRYKELERPKIKTFDSDPHTDQLHSVTEQVSALEKAAMEELLGKAYQKKDELLAAFEAADPGGTGTISVNKWADAMEAVTKLNLPWHLLRDDLIRLNKDGLFAYHEYLTEFRVEAAGGLSGLGVADKLYKNVGALEYIFKLIDADNSGHISHKEFVVACKTLGRYLGSDVVEDDAAYQMARAVDIDKNGYIEFNEFVESFRLVRK
mmetsp:Transcript_4835/g.12396  ORF Transcript_4835/g.12396 Transcript_4835/m.12396 type:complete len:675 (+) Transcript_4835:62-2086(+)|eukprot:CAMPEP_0182928258 /NCGR_PEP_ID=MMETSP0105_2-20130417/15492_1 /TAXON_ID=81532 ORGANISM="Acanthoeca-like sp., Strain 10tr" /NCGR_SAMPLE_ID=MMETSP0105_2 /ASSEMBLY_ACC=CAM_ASM_000205 /LENGTH=674 /DNA_ID=CAMNT_0025066259 /DNA_START=61 /DNA_END=2085 /DNA_ORIENTATION=+